VKEFDGFAAEIFWIESWKLRDDPGSGVFEFLQLVIGCTAESEG
jgi:hypothetical protein